MAHNADMEEDSRLLHTGKAGDIQREIDQLAAQLSRKKGALEDLFRTCEHQWGEIRSVPYETGGYTAPGDPPGTMGVDWRPPVYVPRQSHSRWVRTCQVCGYTQVTQKSTTAVTETKVPQF